MVEINLLLWAEVFLGMVIVASALLGLFKQCRRRKDGDRKAAWLSACVPYAVCLFAVGTFALLRVDRLSALPWSAYALSMIPAALGIFAGVKRLRYFEKTGH